MSESLKLLVRLMSDFAGIVAVRTVWVPHGGLKRLFWPNGGAGG